MEKRIDIFEENRRLRKDLEFQKKIAKEWQAKYYELKTKFDVLEAKLNQILNCNTPSSQVPYTEKDTNKSPNRKKNGTNPRGKPKGGNGGAKEFPKNFDRKLKAKANKCNGCKSHNLKHTHTEEIPVWDFPIIKLIVTLFYRYVYVCKDCGKTVYGTHPDLPKEGFIGPRLESFLTETRHNFAGSYGKLSDFIKDLTGDTFTRQAIKDCIKRVASKLEPSYNNYRDKLKDEPAMNSDETKWPVNGKHFYLWLLCALNFVFIEITDSRKRRVLTNILGEYYEGVIISDCLAVYKKFAQAFQKCWSHLLRKSYSLKEKYPRRDISKLHRLLSDLYDEAEKYRKSKLDLADRIWTTICLTQKMQRIAKHKWKSEESKGIIKNWLKEYDGEWLVGVMMPEIELTNNKDERGIRKVIPIRKMLGGHRTGEGAKDFAIIETHRQTWKLNRKSSYNELVNYLVKENNTALVV